MKHILKIASVFLFAALTLVACKKDESTVSYSNGTNPVLTASVATGSTINLDPNKKTDEAVGLNWTNPNYSFSTGPNTQAVTYTIEIDTLGANFTSGNKVKVIVSTDLAKSLTIETLNRGLVNDLKLTAGKEYTIEMRVVSSLGNNAAALVSNSYKYKLTPFEILKVPMPASGKLFMVGSTTPGGWNNPVPVPSQEFTLINPYTFELTLNLTANDSYLLLPVNGSWGDKYGGTGSSNNSNNPDEDDFSRGGSDLKAPAVSGSYKITVNFKTGKFKLVKQ